MDKRFSLALAVSLLFMMLYLNWRTPPRPPPEQGAAPPEQVAAATNPERDPPSSPTGVQPATDVERQAEIVVDTDLYRARLDNRGGVLRELFSKEYFTDVEVIGDEAAEADPENWLALSLDMDAQVGSLLLRRNTRVGEQVPIETSHWEVEQRAAAGGTDVVFRLDDGAGTHYEKVFSFRDGSHEVGVEIAIGSTGGEARGVSSYLLTAAGNTPGEGTASFQRQPSAAVGFVGQSEIESFEGRQLAKEPRDVEVGGARPLAYFGSHSNHFACVLRPLDEPTRSLVQRVNCQVVFNQPAYEEALAASQAAGRPLSASEAAELREDFLTNGRATAVLQVPRARETRLRFALFAGPKSPPLMAAAEFADLRSLYEADYRSMAWINKTLLWTMRMFHGLTGNWGIAIILLTVLVKALLFPMNRVQSRQMESFQKKMGKLKPELETLKKKYKNNMRKFHEAQQKLMREHGVRAPVFGCLILFLQFPVFIGLFQILRTSFELRQAPFFGWIADLSQPDALPLPFTMMGVSTINILPLLMVAAMVLHSKMMPKPADPQAAQMQKMMLFMPFIFCFFLYGYASGLSLYMLTNALLGIAQAKLLKVAVPT